MFEWIKGFVENCEVSISQGESGWHTSAKGLVALAILLGLIIFLFHHGLAIFIIPLSGVSAKKPTSKDDE